jgi:hypothetical protein
VSIEAHAYCISHHINMCGLFVLGYCGSPTEVVSVVVYEYLFNSHTNAFASTNSTCTTVSGDRISNMNLNMGLQE